MNTEKAILIDLMATQPIKEFKYHGGGEYAKLVFKAISDREFDCKIVCIYNIKSELDEEIKHLCKRKGFKLIGIRGVDEITEVVKSEKVTRFYSALPYSYYSVDTQNIEMIYTIHGLRDIEIPTDRYEILFCMDIISKLKWVYKQLFKEKFIRIIKKRFKELMNIGLNKKIIVPSFHTKYALLSNFPEFNSKDIIVLYSPRKLTIFDDKIDLFNEFGIKSGQYFLIILGSRWTKNNYRAVKALDEIYTQHPEIRQKTILLGVNKRSKVYNFVKNKERFKLCGYVKEEVLERLYKDAYAFIYPTLNEGFGLPPLESMKYGTPVIVSAITSLTEVCDNAALYFCPFDINEIKNRILQLIYEPEIVDELSKRGKEHFAKISKEQDEMLDRLVNIIIS